MRILFDTSIILDVLLRREPFVTEAGAVWAANDEDQLVGFISATTLTDIFYIARRHEGLELAHESVRTCLETFEICVVNRQVLEYAQQLKSNDFEDNVQIAAAELAGLDAIVTRDKAGYHETSLHVFTPSELLYQLNQSEMREED